MSQIKWNDILMNQLSCGSIFALYQNISMKREAMDVKKKEANHKKVVNS